MFESEREAASRRTEVRLREKTPGTFTPDTLLDRAVLVIHGETKRAFRLDRPEEIDGLISRLSAKGLWIEFEYKEIA